MPPRKKPEKPWHPPAGMSIEVCISRGDLYFKAEASPADALNVARFLTLLTRKLTAEAADLLPTADQVPGAVLGYDWAEEYTEGATKHKHPKVGF